MTTMAAAAVVAAGAAAEKEVLATKREGSLAGRTASFCYGPPE